MGDQLAGKTAIVTGSASGIGEAVAKRFGMEGARLALADVNTEEMADTASAIDGDVLAIETDVSNRDEVDAMVEETVEHYGQLDILVNNAGIGMFGNVTDLSDEEWHQAIDIDLNSMFYGCRAAMPHLQDGGGCIVNTASISGSGGDTLLRPTTLRKQV